MKTKKISEKKKIRTFYTPTLTHCDIIYPTSYRKLRKNSFCKNDTSEVLEILHPKVSFFHLVEMTLPNVKNNTFSVEK